MVRITYNREVFKTPTLAKQVQFIHRLCLYNLLYGHGLRFSPVIKNISTVEVKKIEAYTAVQNALHLTIAKTTEDL